MASDPRFDAIIEDLGKGVAAAIENYCNRRFARAVDDTAVFQADRASFILPRYPLEAVTKVELKSNEATGWEVQDQSLIASISQLSGLVYFTDAAMRQDWNQVRFTFTGGYWFEQLEPDEADAGYPSKMPAGATALPSDLRLAWLIQMRDVWNKTDKLNAGLAELPSGAWLAATGGMDLSNLVKFMLNNFKVMQPI